MEQKKRKVKFKTSKKKISLKYVFGITFLTFIIALILQTVSKILMESIAIFYAFILLIVVIMIGIVFDIIGMAVTSADDAAFFSMAADRIRGAKEAISLIKNAEKVSNVANDVIGDVCGIISGSIGAAIIASISAGKSVTEALWLSLLITGSVSALTVGGKAAGKFIAISYNSYIVYAAGKIIALFKRG